MKALQWLLTHSFHAKLLAVKRVVLNQGGKRPLSIPPMLCRAMQALYLLALTPIAEHYSDKNSYGFRPKRSCADAMEMCHLLLSKNYSSQYILEGDIKSCFDKISHQWLRENIAMDKEILNKWLAAGYLEKGALYPTSQGTPQGGVASPTLLNLTLSGFEDTVVRATSIRKDKVHVVTYADDFIIKGCSKEVLEQKVKPVVEAFLKERGLELSKEKTMITHIDESFDFLGITVRKYRGKYISEPSKKSIKHFLGNVREIIKSHPTVKTENLIHLLNPKIRGWAYYFRNCCAKKKKLLKN